MVTSRQTTIEMSIPQKTVGAIIGRQGQNIKEAMVSWPGSHYVQHDKTFINTCMKNRIYNNVGYIINIYQNSKWVWSGNTTITNCRQTPGIVRKSHTTIRRQQEDKQSKATSSLLPTEMIAKLEWTQSNAQQNVEQLQNPTMAVTINNESTTTEPLP